MCQSALCTYSRCRENYLDLSLVPSNIMMNAISKVSPWIPPLHNETNINLWNQVTFWMSFILSFVNQFVLSKVVHLIWSYNMHMGEQMSYSECWMGYYLQTMNFHGIIKSICFNAVMDLRIVIIIACKCRLSSDVQYYTNEQSSIIT
jgi:hypothetical protein